MFVSCCNDWCGLSYSGVMRDQLVRGWSNGMSEDWYRTYSQCACGHIVVVMGKFELRDMKFRVAALRCRTSEINGILRSRLL